MHHLGPGGAAEEERGGASSQGGLVIPPVFSTQPTLAAEGKNAPQMIW